MKPLKRSVFGSVSALSVLFLTGSLYAADWTVNGSGNWSDGTNWSTNPVVPDGAGVTANFTRDISSVRTITIDTVPRTVGIMNVGDTNGNGRYVISGTNLIFDNGGSAAELNFVSSGGSQADTVSAPILLAGNLNLSNAATGEKTIGAISASSSGTKTFTNQGSGSGAIYASGVIGDGLGVVAVRQNSATSALGFSNNQTFSGGFTLDAGIVQLAQFSSLGTGRVTLNGGVMNLGTSANVGLANAVEVNGNITFLNSLSTNGNLTLSGTVTMTGNREFNVGKNQLTIANLVESGGSYSFTKTGAGTVFLGSGQSLNQTGGTIVQSGTLSVAGTGNHLADAAAVSVEGGVLDMSTTETVGTLTLKSGSVVGSGGTFTASGYAVESGSISRALAGTGAAMTKTTSGTVTLSGANTYTGATAVNAGTLLVSGGHLNSSAVSVAAGAELVYNSSTARTGALALNGSGTALASRASLSGTGSINVAITLDNLGDTLSPGNSPGIQAFGVNQAWDSFTYVWETNNFTGTTAGTDFDQIAISGSLNLTGGLGAYLLDLTSLTALNANGDVPNFSEVNRTWTILSSTGISGFNAGNWTIDASHFSSTPAATGTWTLNQVGNDLVLSYTVIPEPSTAALVGFVLMGFVVFRRRRAAVPR